MVSLILIIIIGDILPVTILGKVLVCIALLCFGSVIVAMPTAILGANAS